MRQIGPPTDSGPGYLLPGGIHGDALSRTPGGQTSLDGLRAGDLVLTRDMGPQPILAIHRQDGSGDPDCRTVSVAAQVLGAQSELRLRGD